MIPAVLTPGERLTSRLGEVLRAHTSGPLLKIVQVGIGPLAVLDDPVWLATEYVIKRRSLREIARGLGCHHLAVHTAVRRFGLTSPGRPIQHGTVGGYRSRDCRCTACTAAHTAALADYRARKRRAAPG